MKINIRLFNTILPSYNKVEYANKITQNNLRNLLDEKILALSVKKYFLPKLCSDVSSKILDEQYEYYTYAERVVGRIGISFSEIKDNKKLFEKYYGTSQETIEAIRDIFNPYLSPVDKLRLELDEKWIPGAQIAQFHPNKKMFVGLCRLIEPQKEVLPHQDVIQWDSDSKIYNLSSRILKQLAVNIYLKVPEEGGELELWDYGYKDFNKYIKEAEGTYGIKKSKLLPPVLTLKPEVGEIIIFNPQKFHCIKPGNEQRLTMSCFIGYSGDNEKLSFWN